MADRQRGSTRQGGGWDAVGQCSAETYVCCVAATGVLLHFCSCGVCCLGVGAFQSPYTQPEPVAGRCLQVRLQMLQGIMFFATLLSLAGAYVAFVVVSHKDVVTIW